MRDARLGFFGAALDLPRWSAVPLLVLPFLPHALRTLVPRLTPGERRLALVALALVVIGAGVILRPSVEPWPTVPEARVLDVGQGNAALVRDPGGGAALMDTGPPGDQPAIERRLRRLGVERLDLLVISHGSLDHVGGIAAVLRQAPPEVVALGPEIPPDQERRLRGRFEQAGASVVEATAGTAFELGAWRLEVISPEGSDYRGGDPNPRSLVLHARAPSASAIFTSDAESDALRAVSVSPVDLFTVAHHGSRDAGLGDLLRRFTPGAAAISVGRGNTYGHPTPDTLEALREQGIPVRRTDRDGDIWVRAHDGRAIVGSG